MLGGSLVTTVAGPAPEADAAATQLYVMADSVLLGAKSAIADRFADWQVTVHGFPAIFTRNAAEIAEREGHLIGEVAVVAVGYNYPFFDPPRFDRSIDRMVNALKAGGAKHIVWVTLRNATKANSPRSGWFQVDRYAWYFDDVNRHLEAALDRHPELSLADWEAISDRIGLTYDAIHLNTVGARLMADLIGDSVASAPTRHPAKSVYEMDVAGIDAVPDDAAALALNVTVTDPRASGFIAAFPCDSPRPNASNLNYVRDQTVANLVFASTGADGRVCLFTHDSTQLIVDVVGWFPAGSPYEPRSPLRALDTRNSGGPVAAGTTVRVPPSALGLKPGSAESVVLNITATETQRAGYLSVHSCDRPRPSTSNVNYAPGDTVANFALARVGADGVCIFSLVESHIIVDVAGSFPPGAGPVLQNNPTRALDTRTSSGPVVDTRVGLAAPAPPRRTAIGNLTVTNTTGHGFATAYPCDSPLPLASNLNFDPADTVANAMVTSLSPGGDVCLHANVATDMIVDLTATIADDALFTGRNPLRLHDSRG